VKYSGTNDLKNLDLTRTIDLIACGELILKYKFYTFTKAIIEVHEAVQT
jgi:hypothetical protein